MTKFTDVAELSADMAEIQSKIALLDAKAEALRVSLKVNLGPGKKAAVDALIDNIVARKYGDAITTIEAFVG